MEMIKQVVFDVQGTNVNNRILLEKILILDETCPWVIPNGSPFFAERALTIIYDSRGAELKLGIDYWFEGEFAPFCQLTGRSICSFIKLSERVRQNHAYVTATYQSIGAWFVPRNNLQEWLDEITKGKIPIPWEKIFNVPPELPPEYHKHSAKTEIGDWYELTYFFATMANIYRTRSANTFNDADRIIHESFAQLKAVKAAQLARINDHDANYHNSHGSTKAHLDLGNLDNFATATRAQDKAGTANNLFSTSQGVLALAEDFEQDTSKAMRSGILPISQFGNGGYIPPNISGSFEGLGSRSECMGICVEASGRVVTIQNHFDGRTEGLYFSVLDDYANSYDPKRPYRYDYTAYRYEPPVLFNNGVVPNAIIGGSGNDVIMTGLVNRDSTAATKDRWFVALSNESFDPAGHRYIEVSMANIFAACGNPNGLGEWVGYEYHGRMTVHLLDQYVYLVVDSPLVGQNITNQAGRMSYWRIPRQAIIDGNPATWQLVRITYQDYDGVQYTNTDHWEWAKKVIVNNTVTKWGRYTFSPLAPPAGIGQFARRIVTLFAKKPNTTNIFYLNFLAYAFIDWTPPGKGHNGSAGITNMAYEFNIETGAMTLLYKQPIQNVDFQNNNYDEVMVDRGKWLNWYAATVRYMYAATVLLPTGERLSSITGSGQETSVLNSVLNYGKFHYTDTRQPVLSKADLLKGNVGADRLYMFKTHDRVRNIQTPIPLGIASRQLAYEEAGESMLTYPTIIKDFGAGLQKPKVVCRNVSGGYTVRPEVKNETLAPLYSRPLTNAVYETNLTALEVPTTITGPASELTARGVECGSSSYSSCGWSAKHMSTAYPREYPTAAFRAPDPKGTVITFPKTMERVLDVGTQTMMYNPKSFYGLSAVLRDKIKTLIPAAQRGEYWCFSLHMLNAESGKMFAGMNRAILYVKYPHIAVPTDGVWDSQVFFITPVVEAPNANHPGCHLITDFQVLAQSVQTIAHTQVNLANQGAMIYDYNRGLLSIYRTGNKLECLLQSGFSCSTTTVVSDFSAFTIDMGANTLNQFASRHLGWSNGDPVVNIPKVGRSRVVLLNPDTYDSDLGSITTVAESNGRSGGAARIYPVTHSGGDLAYYAVITAYPETGWTIFFLEEVAVMIQGTMYRVPTGIVDLRDIDTDPRNKVFYVYITIEDNLPKYVISTVKLRRNSAVMMVAIITTNERQILTLERRMPFVVGDHELSYVRDGGIIPVSSGFPQDEGVFKFVAVRELLP